MNEIAQFEDWGTQYRLDLQKYPSILLDSNTNPYLDHDTWLLFEAWTNSKKCVSQNNELIELLEKLGNSKHDDLSVALDAAEELKKLYSIIKIEK